MLSCSKILTNYEGNASKPLHWPSHLQRLFTGWLTWLTPPESLLYTTRWQEMETVDDSRTETPERIFVFQRIKFHHFVVSILLLYSSRERYIIPLPRCNFKISTNSSDIELSRCHTLENCKTVAYCSNGVYMYMYIDAFKERGTNYDVEPWQWREAYWVYTMSRRGFLSGDRTKTKFKCYQYFHSMDKWESWIENERN